MEIHVRQRPRALNAQRFVGAALHDAEGGMADAAAKGFPRAFGPAQRQAHGALRLLVRGRQLHAFVELHLDVGAQQVLDFHRPLRRQQMPRAVDMGLEGDAVLIELAQLGERHHLEAAGIGEDRIGPVHEAMQATEFGDALGARPQHQVIDIAENDIGTQLAYLLRIHCLDGGGCADRHEGRRADLAARHDDATGAGRALRLGDDERKTVAHESMVLVGSAARVNRQQSP